MNVVMLQGTLSRDPESRTLASGTHLLSCDLTVRDPDRATETVPIAWFDPPAAAGRLIEGLEVVVSGRVRRRFFRSGGATISRTEVVADAVVPVRQAARRRRMLEEAGRQLEEPG